MKIVFLVNFFPPKWLAGTEIATYNIAKCLTQKGHEVHVLTSLDKGLPFFINIEGFYVHRIPFRKIRFLSIFCFWVRLFLEINKIRPDIVHIQGISLGIPAVFSKMFFKIPYVVWGQGSDVYLPWLGKALISKIVLSKANRLIALSNNMKAAMQSICKRPVIVIPNGIDFEQFKGVKKVNMSQKKKVLFVGRLHPVKGVNYLIQAADIIRKKGCNIELDIIGDGMERQKLANLVENLNLQDYVNFVGRVEHNDIPKYLVEADVFVLPSLSEGIPLVILEAMASGLPIVATRVGGIPEIVEDDVNGFLVDPGVPEQLADKIMLLFNDDDLRTKMSYVNREKSREYDWKKITYKLEEVYFSIVSGNTKNLV